MMQVGTHFSLEPAAEPAACVPMSLTCRSSHGCARLAASFGRSVQYG